MKIVSSLAILSSACSYSVPSSVSSFAHVVVDIPHIRGSVTSNSHSHIDYYSTKSPFLFNNKSPLWTGIQNFLLVPPANAISESVPKPPAVSKPPTESEIKLLREALGAFYGERNMEKAQGLLTQAITAWERQPPDERAALYRVRGDVDMELLNPKAALQDYTDTIQLLSLPQAKDLADPGEMPAARLGRARAMRSLEVYYKDYGGATEEKEATSSSLSHEQKVQMAQDYQIAFRLTSREDWNTDEEKEQDGASRNPYAAWEYGMALRDLGEYPKASKIHTLASVSFQDIGDRARSVIAALDAGIDMASTNDVSTTKTMLEKAIQSTTSVEGRDVALLQRVIAKEGEARIALASVLWNANEKAAAEAQLGEACSRLEQLQVDADYRASKNDKKTKTSKLPFTIDDIVGTEMSCSRFKNEKFLSDSLFWPDPLKVKVMKLNNLSK